MSYNKNTKLYEGYIYCITNKINGMKYIGQTTTNVKKRWQGHIASANRNHDNNRFHNAIIAYGANNFSHSILHTFNALTKDELCDLLNKSEKLYIKDYNTLHPNGYNMAHGGNGWGRKESPICLYDINGNLIKEYPSISLASQENNIPVCTIQDSLVGRTKVNSLGVWRYQHDSFDKYSIDNSDKIAVVQFDYYGKKIATYESMSEASKVMNVGVINISDACYGKKYTCKGYVWRIKGDKFDKYPIRVRAVCQYTLNGEFISEYPSALQAQKQTGVLACSINLVIQGKQKTAGNFVWCRKGKSPNLNVKSKCFKVIEQYNTNGVYIATYNSLKEASEVLGIHTSSISFALSGKYKTAGGYIWRYAEKGEQSA